VLKSMTGFGRAKYSDGGLLLEVEVRSVNNRFLKIQTRLPERLAPFQADLEALAREVIHRGSVYITVRAEFPPAEIGSRIQQDLLEQYHDLARDLQERFGLQGGLTVEALMGLPGVLDFNRELPPPDRSFWKVLEQPASAALRGLLKMRTSEGRGACKDIRGRVRHIKELVRSIEARIPRATAAYARRLRDRINSLMAGEGHGLEAGELAREVALLADRSDISEEIQRTKSHLRQVNQCLRAETGGRRLEFLVQELFREASTMAAKNIDGPMAAKILDLRGEIDKIKEQAQNIE
jgi:uncharacterized protein (TIGR00255 family)